MRARARAHTHTQWQDWELKDSLDVLGKVLPWDLEMVVEEPAKPPEEEEEDRPARRCRA